MVDEPNPTLARRELSRRLRSLREKRGFSLSDMAKLLKIDLSTASRIDTGARGVKPDHLAKLIDWYGLAEVERGRLESLAEEGSRRGWWQQVKLPSEYRTLIGMEQAAESIFEYTTTVIPGLLQTRDFARAAIEATADSTVLPDDVSRALATRLRRQSVLSRARPPDLSVVIDEAALARVTGGAQTMCAQLAHLQLMARKPGVVVRVIGFEVGLHPGSESHFIIVKLGREQSGLAYSEGQLGTFVSDVTTVLDRYHKVQAILEEMALDVQRSYERIGRYRAELSDRA